MPSSVSTGSSQATYVMSHPLAARDVVVTAGHSFVGWTGTYQEAANRLFREFRDHVVPGLDSNVTFLYVDLYVGADDDPSGSVRSNVAPVVGGAAINSVPGNTALLVRKQTARLGRSGKGRLYMPFYVAEGSCDEGGNIDANVLDDYQASFDAWLEALAGPDAQGTGDLSMVLNNGPNPDGDVPAPIEVTSLVVQSKVATQRRRIRR